MPTTPTAFCDRIASRNAVVGVMGLGYVGLPLAMRFAGQGFRVLGFDVDPAKVERLNAGDSYIPRIASADLAAAVAAGRFAATADPARLGEPDAVLIAVPTPVTKQREPDLTYVEASARALAPALRAGQLVVLESTTYPGTTDEVVRPILEAGGLRAGHDFFLAYSPEREDPGVSGHSIGEIPKVVGADDDASRRCVEALYTAVAPQIVPVSSTRAAEASKVLENIYRAVNIALVNELKILFDRMGIDVWEVIDASSTKPFGFQRFTPGPGIGGHCLPPEEWVRLRGGGHDGPQRIGPMFDQLRRSCPAAVADGGVWLRPEGMETLGLDIESGEVRWARVSAVFRARYRGTGRRIRTRDGRVLTVTDRHPMLVWRDTRFVPVAAEAVHAGDRLPVGSALEERGADPEVDLVAVVPAEERHRVWVRPVGGHWRAHAALLRARCGARAREAIRGNALRLDDFLAVERELAVPRAGLELLTGRGRARRAWPSVLTVTPAFARLVGYYLAEGCITADRGNLRVRWTFTRDEREYVEDVRRILAAHGFPSTIYQDATWHSTTIKASSLLLGWLLRDAWGCGVGSETMRAPAWVFRSGWLHKRELLSGLLRGDGDVYTQTAVRRYRKNGTEYVNHWSLTEIGYFSSSPVLLEQAWTLLQDLGYRPEREVRRPRLQLRGTVAGERLAPLFGGRKEARLRQAAATSRRKTRSRAGAERLAPDLFLAEVAACEPVALDGFVYSLEVDDVASFATAGGVIVHNCIPCDPYYLSWKAREYGTPTRFIELAGEVNAKMARWVAGKVSDALNDRGKPLKGAKVLLLGVAYKKDVGDERESPAFPLAVELQRKGANVSYHDPHVPAIPPKREFPDLVLPSVPCDAATLAAQDAVVIVTDHTAVDYGFVVAHAPLVVDTRNATAGLTAGRDKIVRA